MSWAMTVPENQRSSGASNSTISQVISVISNEVKFSLYFSYASYWVRSSESDWVKPVVRSESMLMVKISSTTSSKSGIMLKSKSKSQDENRIINDNSGSKINFFMAPLFLLYN